jgi:hypothetical protein
LKLWPKAALALSLLAILLSAGLSPVVAQNGANRAALVVRFPDGRVETSCVAFEEPAITGEQVLQRSGFDILINYGGAQGGAVCSINAEGCRYPAEDCFCGCMGTQCEYWAYYHWVDDAWQYSQVGAAGFEVSDGALEGWSWGPGNFVSGTEPPTVAFANICNAAAVPAGSGARQAPQASVAQYAAYGLIAVILLAMGWWVVVRGRR